MSDGDITRLWTVLDGIQKGQSQMISDLARISERTENVMREVARMNHEMGTIKGRVNALESCAGFMEHFKERVAKIECAQADRTITLTEHFRTIDARLSAITTDMVAAQAVSKFKASLLMFCGSTIGGVVVIIGNLLLKRFGGN